MAKLNLYNHYNSNNYQITPQYNDKLVTTLATSQSNIEGNIVTYLGRNFIPICCNKVFRNENI